MRLDPYRSMARYNRWMNRKLYAACGALDHDARTEDVGAFFGSIHGTLNHLLLGDRVWMARFTGDRERFASCDQSGERIQIRSLADVLYADFDELSAQRARTDEDILAWVESLDEAALDSELRYGNTSGEQQAHPLWWALGHLFNHQTHHRGQVTTLLTQRGCDVGATDLIAMMREEQRRG